MLVFWLASSTLRTPALRSAKTGRLVRRYLPLTAGLLFAVHPVATQAVTYIVQRFASLATLFFLLSLALYAQARFSMDGEHPAKVRATALHCGALLAALAAMRTKEISFTLPVIAAGYELVFFRGGKRRFLLLAPLAASALLVPLGLARNGKHLFDVLGNAGLIAADDDIPRSVYLLTQFRVIVTYMRLLLLPVAQNLDYDFRLSHSLGDPSVALAIAVLLTVAGTSVFLLIRARESNRAAGILVFFGIAWFFITLSVESSIIPIRDVIVEHRMYLPSAGAVIALGAALLSGVERFHFRSSPGRQCAAALLFTAGPLGAATYARNFVWKDEVTLWSDAVAKSPEKARPHNALGFAYCNSGTASKAVEELLVAVKLSPGYADARGNLCVAYHALGKLDDAERECRVAILLNPGSPTAHSDLCGVHHAKGQLDDAMHECHEAIRLDPWLATAHSNLGLAYLAKGQLADGTQEFLEAIRLDPSYAKAHYNLGVANWARGQIDYAMREYREAIRIDPGLADAHYNLALAYEAKNQLEDATREFREAIRLNPLDMDAHRGLGGVLTKQGRVLKRWRSTNGR